MAKLAKKKVFTKLFDNKVFRKTIIEAIRSLTLTEIGLIGCILAKFCTLSSMILNFYRKFATKKD